MPAIPEMARRVSTSFIDIEAPKASEKSADTQSKQAKVSADTGTLAQTLFTSYLLLYTVSRMPYFLASSAVMK